MSVNILSFRRRFLNGRFPQLVEDGNVREGGWAAEDRVGCLVAIAGCNDIAAETEANEDRGE